MRKEESLLSAVGCPLSAGGETIRQSDWKRRFFGPILRASPSPFLGKGPDVTCFAAASNAVGCVEVGDFGAPLSTLEMTSEARGSDNQTSD